MASKKDQPAAGGFQIFDKPGTKDKVAINLETGTVVETDGKGRMAFHINGVRHVVVTDQSLAELTGAPEEEATDE